METRKIKIKVAQKKTADGRTFNTYKTFSKNSRAMEVKFRKEVKLLPEKDCYVVVSEDAINVNDSGEYPVVWIKDVISIEDLQSAAAESNRKKLEKYFG